MKSQSEVLQYLASSIEEVTFGRVSAAAIKPDDRIIADLRLDSLDYATVMLGCEQWSGIKLDENRVNWAEIDTVEKLAGLFVATRSK